jgi:pimeloyl-ACP methyl ester carboxylesterase
MNAALVLMTVPLWAGPVPSPQASASPGPEFRPVPGQSAAIAAAEPADPIWPLPFGGRLGWATTSAPNPDPLQAPARVFVLRGTGVALSPDLGKLCTDLRKAGLWAEDLRCVGDRWVCQKLIAERRAGQSSGPVVLVGHSRGARHALYAARELEKAGITVDLLVCMDVAMPPDVPGNVRQALNLYMTRNRLYPASRLQAAPGSAAAIDNVALDASDSPVDGRGLYHVTITANPSVQSLIRERILQVVSAAGSPKGGSLPPAASSPVAQTREIGPAR